MADGEKSEGTIVVSAGQLFAQRREELATRLKDVALPGDVVADVQSAKAARTVRDKFFGLFKLGEVVNAILDWNEEVDGELTQLKKDHLLATYFALTEATGESVEAIKRFITDPRGNTLFNKILQIQDDSPPDAELTWHLGSALARIVHSDFVGMFEAHKYALGQIERLTPQALTILAKHQEWPAFVVGGFQSNGPIIVSPWEAQFTMAYARVLAIADSGVVGRMLHSVQALRQDGLVQARTGQDGTRCVLTGIGQTIVAYLSPPG